MSKAGQWAENLAAHMVESSVYCLVVLLVGSWVSRKAAMKARSSVAMRGGTKAGRLAVQWVDMSAEKTAAKKAVHWVAQMAARMAVSKVAN